MLLLTDLTSAPDNKCIGDGCSSSSSSSIIIMKAIYNAQDPLVVVVEMNII